VSRSPAGIGVPRQTLGRADSVGRRRGSHAHLPVRDTDTGLSRGFVPSVTPPVFGASGPAWTYLASVAAPAVTAAATPAVAAMGTPVAAAMIGTGPGAAVRTGDADAAATFRKAPAGSL
jgi:hypothetical protein